MRADRIILLMNQMEPCKERDSYVRPFLEMAFNATGIPNGGRLFDMAMSNSLTLSDIDISGPATYPAIKYLLELNSEGFTKDPGLTILKLLTSVASYGEYCIATGDIMGAHRASIEWSRLSSICDSIWMKLCIAA